VTLPAFQLGEELPTALDAIDCQHRLPRNLYGFTGLLFLPSRRKSLNEGHQVGALLVRQGDPGRHIRRVEPSVDGIEKIRIRWQGSCGGGATLECSGDKIARQNVEVRRVFAVAI